MYLFSSPIDWTRTYRRVSHGLKGLRWFMRGGTARALSVAPGRAVPPVVWRATLLSTRTYVSRTRIGIILERYPRINGKAAKNNDDATSCSRFRRVFFSHVQIYPSSHYIIQSIRGKRTPSPTCNNPYRGLRARPCTFIAKTASCAHWHGGKFRLGRFRARFVGTAVVILFLPRKPIVALNRNFRGSMLFYSNTGNTWYSERENLVIWKRKTWLYEKKKKWEMNINSCLLDFGSTSTSRCSHYTFKVYGTCK